MQCFFVPVEAVQVPYPRLRPGVVRVLEHMPLKASVMVPFPHLSELHAHEQKLFTRMPVHVAEKKAEVGVPLPFVARHLADERALAVDALLMGKREYEVFGKGVPYAESQLVVVILPADGVFCEVLEGV